MDKRNQALKYILMGMFTGLLLRYIPSLMIMDKDVIMIACCVSIFYALLDKLLPSVNVTSNK